MKSAKDAAATCRTDGRCQYAIDHGAEGMGHCPKGKCCMPLDRPLAGKSSVENMVNSFLGWPLPKTFSPDCGISFDGRKDDAWNKNKTWPIGTNLFTADEARQMFEHVLSTSQPADGASVAVPRGLISEAKDCIFLAMEFELVDEGMLARCEQAISSLSAHLASQPQAAELPARHLAGCPYMKGNGPCDCAEDDLAAGQNAAPQEYGGCVCSGPPNRCKYRNGSPLCSQDTELAEAVKKEPSMSVLEAATLPKRAFVPPVPAEPSTPDAGAVALADGLELVRRALPEFQQQDDYLLAHGASLLSEKSHEIVHVDTIARIILALRSQPAREAEALLAEVVRHLNGEEQFEIRIGEQRDDAEKRYGTDLFKRVDAYLALRGAGERGS